MDTLIELEHVLDNLDFLADTFCAIDLANQNRLSGVIDKDMKIWYHFNDKFIHERH
ncbi:MAG: hypothetical protein IJF32_13120 [Oscillospiraceae bacterium]|nr:hypothetical protein [Oscillospiraceae bacterium]MBQ4316253.1 hypothetical protein [Oscillospiraceae bacterium]